MRERFPGTAATSYHDVSVPEDSPYEALVHGNGVDLAEKKLNGTSAEYANFHHYALVGNSEVGTLSFDEGGEQDKQAEDKGDPREATPGSIVQKPGDGQQRHNRKHHRPDEEQPVEAGAISDAFAFEKVAIDVAHCPPAFLFDRNVQLTHRRRLCGSEHGPPANLQRWELYWRKRHCRGTAIQTRFARAAPWNGCFLSKPRGATRSLLLAASCLRPDPFRPLLFPQASCRKPRKMISAAHGCHRSWPLRISIQQAAKPRQVAN